MNIATRCSVETEPTIEQARTTAEKSSRADHCAHLATLHSPSRSTSRSFRVRGPLMSIGRPSSNPADVCLADRGISRRHAEIRRAGTGYEIRDLGSRNGTYVGGMRLETETEADTESWHPLDDGVVIRMCESILVFRSGDVGSSEDQEAPFLPGRSPRLAQLRRYVESVAELDVPVLVLGETGTGKEFVARAIHNLSGRTADHFIPINCGELSRSLNRAELFGSEAGAYTGARRSAGLVAEAAGGTLFFDEVGELALPVQAELIRFLQDRTYRAVGGTKLQTSDARIVAATNVDLDAAVRSGRFRQDLLARLRAKVDPIVLPPLRDRVEDLEVWLDRFAAAAQAELGFVPSGWSAGFVECLCLHDWPENLRELERTLLTAALAAGPDCTLEPQHLPEAIAGRRRRARNTAPAVIATRLPVRPAADLTREEIVEALEVCDGVVSRAAAKLHVGRRTFYRLCDKYGLDRNAFR